MAVYLYWAHKVKKSEVKKKTEMKRIGKVVYYKGREAVSRVSQGQEKERPAPHPPIQPRFS
jgi:hypothetical protein